MVAGGVDYSLDYTIGSLLILEVHKRHSSTERERERERNKKRTCVAAAVLIIRDRQRGRRG